MKRTVLLGSVSVVLMAGAAVAGTLDDVKARGQLKCGVTTGQAGFSAPDANGVWQGFDVAVCRAVAAAVLGDPMKVEFVPTTGQTRFTALASGEIDVLSRTTTWTLSRDADLKFDFAGTAYYDGQGFMVPKSLNAKSAKDLNGATVCIQTGTTTELNLAEFFRVNNMTYEPVPLENGGEGSRQFQAGACDVYTSDGADLASVRSGFPNPGDYDILPERISKEPLGPLVRQGDEQWGDVVHWALNALIAAEDLGVTAANADQMATESGNPEVKRLLGTEDELGKMLGLDADWAKRAIKAGGNYGELFAANLGAETPLGLERGLNAQWNQGGLIYSQPFR
ncbi:amino acid ABC transporter substrate-binding protein [Albidovulum sp.]|uniref:amino acid ABC transporter substrate-binding protein n=1 Tax=Albidovulum sp. TaxID=1872424 RepID=UPI0039B869CF